MTPVVNDELMSQEVSGGGWRTHGEQVRNTAVAAADGFLGRFGCPSRVVKLVVKCWRKVD